MMDTEYYLIEDCELRNVEELAPRRSAESILNALAARFESGTVPGTYVFVRCRSLEYSMLEFLTSDDRLADRLRLLMDGSSRRNLWMLQWHDPDETIYYIIWRNVLLNLKNVLSAMPPSDFSRLAYELEEEFEPLPGEQIASAVRMWAVDKTPVEEDRDMDDALREFLLAEFERTGCSALICLQWSE